MSINIFQFLKQGTSLSRKQLQKNRKLQQQIETAERTPNKLYMETGKFTESDHEQEHEHSKKGEGQWQQLNQEKMKHKHNKQIQKSIDLRNKYKIKVEGTDAPFLVSNFNSLVTKYYVSEHLIKGLAQMGFKKPTPVQMQAFPALLEDRNVLVTAPTGTGKTLSYLLPLYHNILKKRKEEQHKHQQANKKRLKSKDKKQKNQSKDKLEAEDSLVFNKVEAIILAPQQELSTQIIHQIKSLVSIYEQNESSNVQKVVYKCVSQLSQSDMKKINKNKPFGVNILVATPQIFLNIFGNGKQQLITHCKYIILDECDKYFEESFLQQIRNILEIFSIIKPRPVYGLFSATIQHPVQELLKSEIIDDALRIQIGGKNKVISNVQQTIQYCTNQYGKILQLKNMIAQNKFIPPALIFVQQKIRAKQLYFEMKKIMKNGPGGLDLSKKIQVLSGQKSKEQRKQILQKFEKGNFLVLITTDLIARGIDFSHVNLVINYDFPNSMLTYIHRVGRTGRAERTGYAVTFFTEEDKPIVKSLANLLAASGCKVPQWILQFPNVNKNLKKRLQKYPTKRLPVGVSQGRDKNFDKQLQRMEKIWKIKKQREIQRQKNVDGQQEQEEWIQV